MSAVTDRAVGEYLDQLASTTAVPGGGSAAALAGAMGVALVAMVARISARKAKVDADRDVLLGAAAELDALRSDLGRLSQEDIDAYRAVLDLRKAHGDAAALDAAIERAATVPLETAQAAARGRAISEDVVRRAWAMTRSDVEVGRDLLGTALRGALANVEVNLPDLHGEAHDRIDRAYRELAAAVS
jgi:formiminotetrahydrofolate cyclodeaminase